MDINLNENGWMRGRMVIYLGEVDLLQRRDSYIWLIITFS